MQLLGLLKVVPAGDVADACDAIMDSGVVDNLFMAAFICLTMVSSMPAGPIR